MEEQKSEIQSSVTVNENQNTGNAGKNDIVSNPKVSRVCVLSDKAFMLIVASTE